MAGPGPFDHPNINNHLKTADDPKATFSEFQSMSGMNLWVVVMVAVSGLVCDMSEPTA